LPQPNMDFFTSSKAKKDSKKSSGNSLFWESKIIAGMFNSRWGW